jgi:hypothetical protein
VFRGKKKNAQGVTKGDPLHQAALSAPTLGWFRGTGCYEPSYLVGIVFGFLSSTPQARLFAFERCSKARPFRFCGFAQKR